mmetsp:Transcript_47334/g.136751  ORF Transcript_47334/g.136751 Transcript_47334/m.136751 type:complete len:92 (+) Transcript_47334:197-472(+)
MVVEFARADRPVFDLAEVKANESAPAAKADLDLVGTVLVPETPLNDERPAAEARPAAAISRLRAGACCDPMTETSSVRSLSLRTLPATTRA